MGKREEGEEGKKVVLQKAKSKTKGILSYDEVLRPITSQDGLSVEREKKK